MPGRIQAIKLAVQHVRDDRQGTPVVQKALGQRLPNSRKRQAVLDVRILVVDESLVVESNELVAHSLAEDEALYEANTRKHA